VDSKYDNSWGGWCSPEPIGAFQVGVWKFIRKGWDSFSSFTRFVVEDSSRIGFWHDLWCGNTTLKVAFPTQYDIARVLLRTIWSSWMVPTSRTRAFLEAHHWEVDFLLLFSRHCIMLECEETRKTSCGGSPPKKVCSRSSPSFAPWPVLEVAASPGKVCGALKLLQWWFFRVASGSWQDSYLGQSQEVACDRDKHMLHV
jgi:hypothetical protein